MISAVAAALLYFHNHSFLVSIQNFNNASNTIGFTFLWQLLSNKLESLEDTLVQNYELMT